MSRRSLLLRRGAKSAAIAAGVTFDIIVTRGASVPRILTVGGTD
jgi:hypothetical protein